MSVLRRMSKKIQFSILLLFQSLSIFSQGFEIGTWKEYLPYRNVIHVAEANGIYYAATPFAIYYVNKDNSIERYNKINALSDLGINVMDVNLQEQTIIIGYQSGNIDLIKNGEITNLSGIKVSNIIGDKQIYALHSEGKYTYLACGFGIVVVDVERQEIKDTYYIQSGGNNLKVNDITIANDSIFAITDNGVYKADVNNSFLSNPSVWQLATAIPQINYNSASSFNQGILLNAKYTGYLTDTLYYYKNGVTQKVTQLTHNDYYAFKPKGNDLIISSERGVIVVDNNFQQKDFLYTYSNTALISPNDCIWDGDNYWIGDRNRGLVKSRDNFNYEKYIIEGPYFNDAFYMTTNGDDLWVAAGRTEGTAWNSTWNMNGVYHYNQETWSFFNGLNTPEMNNVDSVFDCVYVTIDKKDDQHIFVSSFKGGILEFKDGELLKRHTWYNSTLQRRLDDSSKVCVAGTAMDEDGNLWGANSFVNKPLSVYTKDGQWKSFSGASQIKNKTCTDLYIDQTNGYIWLTAAGVGIMVYDYNKTPLDESDDTYKVLTTVEGQGNLPYDIVNCVVEDKQGQIWIGTEQGPVVIYSPRNIFEGGDFDAQEVLIDDEGVLQVLLGTEDINEIRIDGANRKWFATEGGGLFLISADGTKMIHGFTEENSPIFSNKVSSLAINPNTGEVYVGTEKGIMAYKSEATEPNQQFTDVYAYPNPVRPSYDGKIAIKGLSENTDIKITDANGNLVYSTTSLGGQAIWDGKTMYGERVATGIYYVFVTAQDASEKLAVKLLFMN